MIIRTKKRIYNTDLSTKLGVHGKLTLYRKNKTDEIYVLDCSGKKPQIADWTEAQLERWVKDTFGDAMYTSVFCMPTPPVNVQTAFTMPANLFEKINTYARLHQLSRSAAIAQLVEKGLKAK